MGRPAVVVVLPGFKVCGFPAALTAVVFNLEKWTRSCGEDVLVVASGWVVCGHSRPALKPSLKRVCVTSGGTRGQGCLHEHRGDDFCVKVSTCCECSVSV